MSDTTGPAEAQQPALVRVVRGAPTPAQLAALTVVLSAAGGGGDTASERPGAPRTLWTARARFARPRPSVGPDGWRASALPR
ncbi:acyl-CoA carboxylase subunit epsilon [uncultured Serinicoccus sp.]|uniref:acyl-CoA carboxylase subunit epsilon n=1 Tax=uncultured Serinicoccus sp. TaxID=735514 RepID=UPI002606EF31|nr:acyl-CoA carboxylase subunit epsilon [uncultured Serinicoccus sp.]